MADRAQEARDRLTAAIAAMRSEDGWRRYVAGRKLRRRYSFRNQLLIAVQNPDATRVMGFKSWLKFGRCVAKGEKAIWIYGPMAVKLRRPDGTLELDASGRPKRRTLFQPVPVFDIAQTHELDGDGPWLALDPPPAAITGDGDEAGRAFSRLANWLTGEGWTVEQREDSGRGDGFCRPADRLIVVRSTLPDLDALGTLIHEAAHGVGQVDYERYDRATAEAIVESVAWLALDDLGISSGTSLPYIAGWHTAPEKVITDQAVLIDRLARTLADAARAPAPAHPLEGGVRDDEPEQRLAA